MKFQINKLILWLRDGGTHTLEFEPNKINVVSGNSKTGKTAILEIIDYCLCSSSSRISHDTINENVEWYGLNILINDKNFTLARASLTENKVSNDYYFSSIGEEPDTLIANNTIEQVKDILETEFSIDSKVRFPYGGNTIRANSKISFRYFLMFNTISQDLILNSSDVYFDKQNDAKYKEALHRIFDISTGIETIQNILLSEKKQELEASIAKLERKLAKGENKSNDFRSERQEILKTAREYHIIDNFSADDEAYSELYKKLQGGVEEILGDPTKQDDLKREKASYIRQLNNLKSFQNEYSAFKKSLNDINESLKPIEVIKESSEFKTEGFEGLLEVLTEELRTIKSARSDKTPIDRQVKDKIVELDDKIKQINEKLASLASEEKVSKSEAEKYVFVGRIQERMALYSDDSSDSYINNLQGKIKKKQSQLNEFHVNDTRLKRETTIALIGDILQSYMNNYGEVFGNYSDYILSFDYKEKSIKLRKPETDFYENVGSSSDHMFLHLFFSLAMHQICLRNKSPFIPPLLIIDQPSRPYYGDNKERKDDDLSGDNAKIRKAFELLNDYIQKQIDGGNSFQMIVFEHIPEDLIMGLTHVHFLEQFRDGNALIPVKNQT